MRDKTKAELEAENKVLRDRLSDLMNMELARGRDETSRARDKWLHRHGVDGKHYWWVGDDFCCDRCDTICPGAPLTKQERRRLREGEPFPKPAKRRATKP
jgi:hypothetical protein